MSQDRFESLPTNALHPDPNQPRKHYTEHALTELAASLVAVGQIEPLVVRPLPNSEVYFQIVCGERRYRAALLAGLEFLNCHIRELTDDQVFEIQIIENLQREEVDPLDECDAFHALITKRKYSMEDLAQRFGKSTDYIFGRLRLSALIPKAKEKLHEGILPITAAIKIASISDVQQEEALKRLVVTIETSDGIKEVFTGLRDMKAFFDNSILLPLAKADFDTNSDKLLPCGSCIVCPKRTGHNTLFQDIADDHKCLDRSCYHDKHVRHYQQLAFELGKEHGEVVFAARHYGVEKSFKDLGEVLTMFEYEAITEAQAELEENAQYVVFVGIDSTDDEKRIGHGWVKLKNGKKPKSKTHVNAVMEKKQKVSLSDQLMRDELYYQYIKQEANLHDTLTFGVVEKLWSNVSLATIPNIVLTRFLGRYELSFSLDVFNAKSNDWVSVIVDQDYEHDPNCTPIDISPEAFRIAVEEQIRANRINTLFCELQFLAILSGTIEAKPLKESMDLDVNAARQNASKRLAEIKSKPVVKKK